MSPSGVYEMPMGSTWATRNSAFSNGMEVGDQKLRYLFLSTCDSVRTTFGDNPWRTWNGAVRGCRMIFGFGSTSLDWWAYGQNFFSIWNTGVSFSQAWQDASFRLTQNQVVSSTACGATAEEAQNRLWNERLFNGGRVSDDWYWWRWNGISPDVEVQIVIVIGIPTVPMRFKSARRSEERARTLAERFGVELISASTLDPGSREAPAFAPGVVQSDDDTISVLLEPVDIEAELVSNDALMESASAVVSQLDPDGRLDLVLDRFTSTYHAGASRDGDRVEAAVGDFTAHYRQRFEGVPAVMGGAGHVAITLDRSGRPCRIVDRSVDVIEAEPDVPPPDPDGAKGDVDIRKLLDEAQQRRYDPCGDRHLEFDPELDEVGYRFVGGEGVLVARREVTVSSGGLSKAHVVEIPLSGRAGGGADDASTAY